MYTTILCRFYGLWPFFLRNHSRLKQWYLLLLLLLSLLDAVFRQDLSWLQYASTNTSSDHTLCLNDIKPINKSSVPISLYWYWYCTYIWNVVHARVILSFTFLGTSCELSIKIANDPPVIQFGGIGTCLVGFCQTVDPGYH